MHLPFVMLCLSAISMMFVKIMLVGMVVCADSVSSPNCVQSAFFVVGESLSVLL